MSSLNALITTVLSILGASLIPLALGIAHDRLLGIEDRSGSLAGGIAALVIGVFLTLGAVFSPPLHDEVFAAWIGGIALVALVYDWLVAVDLLDSLDSNAGSALALFVLADGVVAGIVATAYVATNDLVDPLLTTFGPMAQTLCTLAAGATLLTGTFVFAIETIVETDQD